MVDGPGFTVRPDVLRAVASGLRDDAAAVRATGVDASGAAQAAWSAGAPLETAGIDLETALGHAAGAVQRDLDDLVRALEATATGYVGADGHGASAFGDALTHRLLP